MEILTRAHAHIQEGYVRIATSSFSTGSASTRRGEVSTIMTHLAMALTAIAHRIGREALVAELYKTVPAEQPREVSQTRADQILARPTSSAEEHFALFYRGLPPEDLARVMRE